MKDDTVRITLRLDKNVHSQLVTRAAQDKRSLNSEIAVALESWLQSTEKNMDTTQ